MKRTFALRAGPLALALAALAGGAAPIAGDAVADAREQFKAGKWQAVVDTLQEHLRFAVADPDTDDLLGQALVKLGRKDEAANHFDRALSSVAEDDKRVAMLRKRLTEADPLNPRRDALFRKIAHELAQSAEQLEQGGHGERALEVLERIRPIASGAERAKIAALADKIRSSTEQVNLDKAGGPKRPDAGWPEIELESKRYKLKVHLEPEVGALLGATMDEIFEYYIRIYFDGDAKKVSSQMATIVVHESHPAMMKSWTSPGPQPAGWFSPGEMAVHCYDTRTDSGTLDAMLETLFHEASHHFMNMLGQTPAWLNEGTASFFEGATALADGTVLWPDAAWQRLQSLNAMLGGNAGGTKIPSLNDVVSYNQPGSYAPEYYPFGWGLVYFMQQYEDPKTLEYVYRPAYAAYREQIIKRGDDPKALFEQVFIGPKSPGKQPSFAAWEQDWRKWIQGTVYPLHFGDKRREQRMALVDKYLAGAKAAAGDKKAKVSEQELLVRALGHIEYVRSKIDKPESPDAALVLSQADVLEKLGRGGAAAPLLELLLEMTADGRWKVDEVRVAEIEARLAKLDQRNSSLRVAQSRAKGLARSATQLLSEYESAKVAMPLRSYTFATLAAAALDDTSKLSESAARLRTYARENGLLHGSMYKLVGVDGTWRTIFTNKETAFEHDDHRIVIEAVRPVGKLCTAVPISGEYELRARITRVGQAKIGTHHGLIVSGTAAGDWTVVTVDHSGKVLLKRMNLGAGGGVTDIALSFAQLKHELPVDKPIEFTVHVFPEGKLEATIDGEGPFPFQMPLALPAVGHAGVYVKYGRAIIEDALVEILP